MAGGLRRGYGRCVVLGSITLALSGCGVAVSLPDGTGPCELEVLADARQELEVLQRPYVVELMPPDTDGQTAITFRGSGWRTVQVTVIDPTGSLADDYDGPGDMINTGFVAFPVDAPGSWRFRLSDGVAGCVREFTVEVRAPAGS